MLKINMLLNETFGYQLFDNNAKNKDFDLNKVTYFSYLMRLSLLSRCLFEWNGLPDTCDERYLEKALFEDGQACLIYDEELGGFLSLKCNADNLYSVYGEPLGITAIGSNGYNKHFENSEDYVFIRNNDECFPTFNIIMLYAYRLTNTERTADVNLNAQKTPVVITCTKQQEKTFRLLYERYSGNLPLIFGDKDLELENIKVLKTDAPFIVDKLLTYKHDIWNECMTFLGINNANTDKKERLITNEVESNAQQVMAMSNIMFKSRLQACEEINKKFGLNVSVRRRTREEVLDMLSEKGELEDEQLHNDSE